MCLSFITYAAGTHVTWLSSIRIVIAFWLLANVVILGAYTGKMFSQKVGSGVNFPFTDLETFVQCLEKGQCRFVTPSLSLSYFQSLTTPGTALGVRIGRSLEKNPPLIDSGDLYTTILKEQSVYLVTPGPRSRYLTAAALYDGCPFYAVNIPYLDYFAFPVAKNSSFIHVINKITHLFNENGVSDAIDRRYLGSMVCDTYWSSNTRSTSWFEKGNMLGSMATTFYVLVVGHVLAIGSFLGEVYYTMNRRRRKISTMWSIGSGYDSEIPE